MGVPVGVSNRHIHLTQKDADALFGVGYIFHKLKSLRQTGQYACEERVTISGPKGSIDLREGVILPQRHIHMNPFDAAEFGVRDKDLVAVKTHGERQVILENVLCRVDEKYVLEFHIDTDEANASGLSNGDLVKVIKVDAVHEIQTFTHKRVLVLNCGSSSVKYKLYDMPDEKIVVSGNLPRCAEHTLDQTLDDIFGHVGTEIDIIAHRVVHGADIFNHSTRLSVDAVQQLESIHYLAPLHNPINLEGVRIATSRFPTVPHVAVFDTSFHQTMPPTSYLYPIPYEYYEKHKIRKYGFHGMSHRYVDERAAQIMEVPMEKLNIISCHIGNGVSVTAIRNGESYSTSMGFTPLSGLAIGTRSGNIDPGIIPYLEELEGLSPSQVIEILNHQSGLLGVSGISHDVRVLLEHEKDGNPRAHLALELFIEKLHSYIGLCLAKLNGAAGIVFAAGIGENSPEIREKICTGLEFAGVYLDHTSNWEGQGERIISSRYSPMKVMVIPTNEEVIMARDAYWCVVK